MLKLTTFLLFAAQVFAALAAEESVFDFDTGRAIIDARGYARIEGEAGQALCPVSPEPIVQFVSGNETILPDAVTSDGDRLKATFPGGASLEFVVRPDKGFLVFELARLDAPKPIEQLRLFSLALPQGAEIMGTLNAGRTATHVVTLSAAEPNVHAFTQTFGRSNADRAGCTHEFAQSSQAKDGTVAARFTATCDAQADGWSFSDRSFARPLDLTGCKAIRAWIYGDGKGELLKIQLYDGLGGYRDAYIPITFEGWKQVTVAEAPINTLRYDRAASLNLYYNALPASQTVSCLVDQIEAVLERDGKEESILLEDFESGSPFWAPPVQTLNLETLASHGLQPARFGLLVSSQNTFSDMMERFETAAGLPSPHPGGVWSKQSPWIKRSYLFITSFSEAQYDAVLALAKRGGFDMILIGQESWARATGHYEINTTNFPDGLDGLKRTIQRFKQEGFHVGLHFLGPSIYPPDPYLTPTPDPRLFKDASADLAADIDAKTGSISTNSAPETFPAQDGGYEGDGAILQIGDELIAYGARAMTAPTGFQECQRGILGTTATPHAKGERIQHVKKSYGYFLFDMDTSLIDEVSTNFANVANACDIDMIYFDGSERLQGDHWYYNARLHKAFHDKLARKDILMQASSYSHYSWHLLSRSASADGHGDLKGYLDERSAWLDAFRRDAMPLDIGWYYGYDPNCTIDMYEYVLGATIGYDSSMSYQVSLDAASKHPFTGALLDLIARYEKLRLSGRVPDDMRARLRIDPALAGAKSPEERAALLDLRRDYRLLDDNGRDAFQRVVYDPWHEVSPAEPKSGAWTTRVKQAPSNVGIQIHAEPGPWLAAGPSYHAEGASLLEAFDDLAPYAGKQAGSQPVTRLANGEGGATLPGVTQTLEISDGDAREGAHCAVYTAESALGTDAGWAVVTKVFNPPLDLAWHKAIGFWLRGDGNGGLFKLQLTDGNKAADFYVSNDYAGWRYQQLARPEVDPMDYRQVRTLSFYYNGLPGKTKVSCAVDDVKALPKLDVHMLSDPWVEVGGVRLSWRGNLTEGQYVFLWPGEAACRYGLPLTEPEHGGEVVPVGVLAEGEHTVQFGCAGPQVSPVRVRVTLQPPERYAMP